MGYIFQGLKSLFSGSNSSNKPSLDSLFDLFQEEGEADTKDKMEEFVLSSNYLYSPQEVDNLIKENKEIQNQGITSDIYSHLGDTEADRTSNLDKFSFS